MSTATDDDYAEDGYIDDGDSSHTGYACEGSELQIKCSRGTVIRVLRANYGRRDPAICNDHGRPETWDMSCVANRSLAIVRNR